MSRFGLFTLRLLTLCVAALAVSSAALAQPVVGLEIWYVDEPGRMIYKVNHNVGTVLTSFAVPPQVGTPAGLAVSGTPTGGTNLWLLDSAAHQIYRLDSVNGAVLNVIPAPSANSIGIGAACIVPQNVEELFVVANDGNPGALYWIVPATGAIINYCALGVTAIRDATAFAQGNNATGVCFLRDINPGGTEIRCVNKISCQLIWSRTYPWEGWGLGNRTEGTVQGTATELYASDLGANIIHVLSAVDGTELGQFATATSGANIRGVGGDSTCPVKPVDVDMEQYVQRWTAAGDTTFLYYQRFEVGVTGANCTAAGWTPADLSGRGNFADLFPGAAQVQEDLCVARDLRCLWAFINGSTEFYGCGGFPTQKAVPFGSGLGKYLCNEIWSPSIPLIGSGSAVNLNFSVYRDLSVDHLVFYVWHVRNVTGGVPGPWRDRGLVFYGNQKDWLVHSEPVGDLLDLSGASQVQIALGAWDMCGAWCGFIGTGGCHSHAPLIDTVRLVRVNVSGPQWSIRDMDQFQDNFAADGTTTGWVRADMAADILPVGNPGILPGDSAVVSVADPIMGIADDVISGGKKIYIYVAVWPLGQPGKSGSALTQNPARFPFKGYIDVCGTFWTCLRLDDSPPGPDSYCIDLNDCVFEPCDTVCYFYCAESKAGVRTYAFENCQGTNICQAAANAYEFTCLPAGGWKRGGDILYVDGMDGRNAQPLWDTAFKMLGLEGKVDRYDVRAPSSAVGNRLGSRVIDVNQQLLGCYRKILWDCGDLEITLGDGTGMPEKTNDYCLLNDFLDGLTNSGGVYLCGDEVPTALNGYAGACAVAFNSTFVTYGLATSNHRPTYGITPKGVHNPTGCFSDDFWIFGGCPLVNDFDVMTPTGSSVMEVGYGAPAASNGATISKVTTNSNNVGVGVILSGFSFIYLADDENDGISDRADHLYDILTWLNNNPPPPTGSSSIASNKLLQNYPNPFNPQTTIAFSLKSRGHVSLRVYNVAGELVRTLVDEERAAGPAKMEWDGRDSTGQKVSSGVYFYKLVAGDFSQTKKMILLK